MQNNCHNTTRSFEKSQIKKSNVMTFKFVKREKSFDCADLLEPFRCSQCFNFQIYKLTDLKWHIQGNHSVPGSEENRYDCKSCDFRTFSKFLFLIHQANLCLNNAKTKSKSSVSKKKKSESLFRCEYCSYTTNTASHFRRHVLCKHTDPEKIQWSECAHCPFKTKLKHNLIYHIKHMHKELPIQNVEKKNKSFKCEYCSYTAKTASHFKRHVLCRHTDLEKIQWTECAHCPYKTKLKHNLIYHIKHTHQEMPTSHAEKENATVKLFNCEYCSYTTKTASHFQRHVLWKHTAPEKIQWFKCEHCPFKSRVKQGLVYHVAQKHKETPTSRVEKDKKTGLFKCDYCPYTTRTGSHFKRHVLRKHTDPDKIQWFKCEQCSYKSKINSDLKVHIAYMHEDRKSMNCDQCSFATKRKIELRNHMIAKHADPEEIQWFECVQCTFKCKIKRYLIYHIARKHKTMST